MLSILWRQTGQRSKDHILLPNHFNFNVLKALPTVDVCILPYYLLLVPSARESCGIDLTNSVLIIDEAHNLAGAIESSYSNVLGLDSRYFTLMRVKHPSGSANQLYNCLKTASADRCI